MIEVKVQTRGLDGLQAFVRAVGPNGRAQLNRVGANAITARVMRHIHGYAMGKHFTAHSLGGVPTGHYEKGLSAITSKSDANAAEVSIPIPGISRAFHDIELTTPTARGKRYLTIAKHGAAYGHTVGELRARGWKIFRPGKKKVLLGYRQKGEKPVLLYALAEGVRQRRDERLLPTREEMGRVFCEAVRTELRRILRKAGK